MSNTLAAVLLVDDEEQVLNSLVMNLKRRFRVVTAVGGEAALSRLAEDPDFAVIVSDMRMPNMDGAEFLAAARRAAPMAVRMLLTGQTQIKSAISAVNEGQIFRFLTKPTPPPALLAAVDAAVAQHRLITAEKVLLEQTLRGSLQAMSEILSLSSPALFGQATRVKLLMSQVIARMDRVDHWQIQIAAMLWPLARISLPPETATRLSSAEELSAEEQAMTARLPELSDKLLAHIPRLETVRAMLARAQEPSRPTQSEYPVEDAGIVDFGGALLKAAIAFDALTQGGRSAKEALRMLRGEPGRFDADIVAAIAVLHDGSGDQGRVFEIPLSGLQPGMVLAEDIQTNGGMLVVTRGYEVTTAFIERIRNYRTGTLKSSLRIYVAPDEAQD
jgi:response regulator RpfG family c-di-GMP phosphodiesterase